MTKDEIRELMFPLREHPQCTDDCTIRVETDETGVATVTIPVCHGHFHCLSEILAHLKK